LRGSGQAGAFKSIGVGEVKERPSAVAAARPASVNAPLARRDGLGLTAAAAGRSWTAMARRFEGKIAVITGASTGIGAAAARMFASEGAAVVLAARSAAALEALAGEIGAIGGRALAVPTDVGETRSAERLLTQVAERFGGIDVLVNNAGANKRGPIERYSAEELATVVQVNLTAPIVLTRLVLPYLRQRGGGAIVNVASIAGRIPVGHEAVYSATKFGLRAFTFALTEELEGSRITVSAVSPGPVDTGFIMENLDEVPDVVFAQPMSTAEDIARAILDCAADGALERTIPQMTGYLATAGYLFPAMRKLLFPFMERRGRQAKETYRQRQQARG
jgi:short-subunit dehydrogenase